MKHLLFILLLLPFLSLAQPISLSEHAKISVITCGPYQGELYSAFGHSAFRVFDPVNRIDEAYNYGIFDFNQPHFYLNFARGYLYYKLGINDYQHFQHYYIYYNRYVHEQELNLDQHQKQKMYDYLQWNALPENVHYRYDYFYNNCATKMRDVVVEVLGDAVQFDGSYIKTSYTIRELTDIYLEKQPWGDLGIDICLGLPMDKVATPYEHMFLPDYVESGFDHASITTNGERMPLVKKKNIVYEPREAQEETGPPHPLLVFSIMAVLAAVLTYVDMKRRKLSSWFDATLFTVIGLIGLLLFFLWFFTDHNAAVRNFNLLWALPTHIVAAIAMVRNPTWLKKYFMVVFCLAIITLLAWPLLPQKLHYALIPVVITIGLRAFAQFKLRIPN